MNLENKEISKNSDPYLIAELSGDHGGSLERALNTIKLASDSNCDAVKFQVLT